MIYSITGWARTNYLYVGYPVYTYASIESRLCSKLPDKRSAGNIALKPSLHKNKPE